MRHLTALSKGYLAHRGRGGFFCCWGWSILVLVSLMLPFVQPAHSQQQSRIIWKYPLNEVACPHLAIAKDGTIYVSAINEVVALSPSGAFQWKYGGSTTTSGTIFGPPSVDMEGNVYFVVSGPGNYMLHSLTKNGAPRWARELVAHPQGGYRAGCGAVAIDQRLSLIYASGVNTLRAFSATGAERWVAQSGEMMPAIGNRLFAFNWSDSPLIVLDPNDGRIEMASTQSSQTEHPFPPV